MANFPRERVRACLLNELALLRAERPGKVRKKRNAVIGLAAYYGVDRIRTFVRSFRRHNDEDDLLLIVASLDPETRAFLKANRVKTVHSFGSLFSCLHIQSARHVVYYDLLANEGRYGKYDRIFLTDVRDVVFQGDLFREIPDDRISFFLEDPRIPIKSCKWNADWILTGFGPEMLAALGDKPISCSGTVLGKADAVMEYLIQMQLHYTVMFPEALDLRGIDQGVHNVIVYQGVIPKQKVLENGDGILTIGNTLGDTSTFVSEGDFAAAVGLDPVFLDQEGRFHYNMRHFSVVHQYDRNPQLAQRVDALYA